MSTKPAKTGSPTASTNRTRTLLRVLAVLLVLAATYFALVWLQLQQVRSRGVEIEERANEVAVSLGAAVEQLRDSPGSATEIGPDLEAGRESLDELLERIGGVSARALPPAAAARRAYRDALRSYVSDIGDYSSQLSTITAQVAARTETVQRLSEGFGQLDKLSEEGITEEALKQTLESVEQSVVRSIDELRSIAASGAALYSSTALVARLSAVSAVIEEVLGGLGDRDQERLDRGAQSFAQLMKGDWQSLLLQYDLRGLGQVATNMKELSERREQMSDARDRVVSAQKAVGAIALVLFIGALVCAGFGWRRQAR